MKKDDNNTSNNNLNKKQNDQNDNNRHPHYEDIPDKDPCLKYIERHYGPGTNSNFG